MTKFGLATAIICAFTVCFCSAPGSATPVSFSRQAMVSETVDSGSDLPKSASGERDRADEKFPVCSYDEDALLAVDFDEFEAPLNGWRALADREECRAAVGGLLEKYRLKNWSKLQPHEIHLLYWHEGQARAIAGETDRAVPLLLSGVGPNSIWGFADYALATVAFLQHDRPSLRAARDRLARMPEPEGFREFASSPTQAVRLAWPPDLDVVEGLLRCFDKPYAVAYSSTCRREE